MHVVRRAATDPKDVCTIGGMMGQTGDASGIPWAAKVHSGSGVL